MKNQSKFWARYFKFYDVLLKFIPYQELLSTIVKKADLREDSILLDAGSGTGNLLYYVPDDTNVVSLDSSETALDVLQEKFSTATTVKCSLLNQLPFEDASVDRIISNNVLYTLKRNEWPVVISEFNRIMKAGGVLVISNLKQGFDPFQIYKLHIKEYIARNGRFSGLAHLIKLAYPTIRIFMFNHQIMRMNATKNYSFLKPKEQSEVFRKFGFQSRGETIISYGGQAYLDVFQK